MSLIKLLLTFLSRHLERRKSGATSAMPEPRVPQVQRQAAATPSREPGQLPHQRVAGLLSGKSSLPISHFSKQSFEHGELKFSQVKV